MEYRKDTALAGYVENLFRSQMVEWKMLARNYDNLNAILHKEIVSDGFSLQLQYNPGRIRSSSAGIDAASILKRPCFLCPANLPEEQKAIDYSPDYNILINPYPIFEKHLTIACKQHTPQRINGRTTDMLRLAYDLQDYVILYNGPQSGASAPDHLHLQAGIKGFLPVENDIRMFHNKKILKKENRGVIYTMEHYMRKALVLQSDNSEWLTSQFESLLQFMVKLNPSAEEPMFNMIALYDCNLWTLVVFPRAKHRPSLYYAEGDRQVLFSPGVVDFGGLLIFPRKEDFDKMNCKLIEEIFEELTLDDSTWTELLNLLQSE